MFSPDCICVCSFSTTSPSPIRSWVTLIPVIAVNAGASTLDSYSWVVIVSDTTLISIPAKGWAASMNHCISASWPARSSVERSPISLSRKVLASSIPASARFGAPVAISASAMAVVRCSFMSFLPNGPFGPVFTPSERSPRRRSVTGPVPPSPGLLQTPARQD